MKSNYDADATSRIFRDIADERIRQEKLKVEGKFDDTCADFGLTDAEKLCILAEEFGEVSREVTEIVISDHKRWEGEEPELVLTHQERVRRRRRMLLRKELIEVAAVAVAWIEALNVQLGE